MGLEAEGMNIGQTIAIVNYVGKKAKTEGDTAADFCMSQTLLAEGEDLYAGMQKFVPTVFVKLGQAGRDGSLKGDLKGNETFWAEQAPDHLNKLEVLLGGKSKFT